MKPLRNDLRIVLLFRSRSHLLGPVDRREDAFYGIDYSSHSLKTISLTYLTTSFAPLSFLSTHLKGMRAGSFLEVSSCSMEYACERNLKNFSINELKLKEESTKGEKEGLIIDIIFTVLSSEGYEP
ncbi:hypothetical protein TNCT_309841 [Trichonephila clavata]|uniref:Uncharacterized protein n=1 Tax=Trichonephila clavata TaxID=2740835 RepID=A0A8X6J036_TRICU|nr:hypothetical protein TNCT_309841 [Trichonephila clavata]